jgi:DNA-binding transcriptional LysR family regulator
MDPRRLLTFRMVAHECSFSRAAAALALTQPSVSQQVAALETELGARLLDRSPGGLTLTPAGAVLLPHADAVADRLALAGVQLAELVAQERGTLRVGANPSAVGSLVPPLLAALAAQGSTASVRELRAAALVEGVRDGGLHLAITFQDAAQERREPEGLERVDLLHEPFVAALPPGHRLAGQDAVDLADLADEPWTAPSTDGT